MELLIEMRDICTIKDTIKLRATPPLFVTSVGRGNERERHPSEIRIPGHLHVQPPYYSKPNVSNSSIDESVINQPRLNRRGEGGPRQGQPRLNGRGRGGPKQDPVPVSLRSYSRKKLIQETLKRNSKMNNLEDGKKCIMDRFLGLTSQQPSSFPSDENVPSLSSGFSRNTSPAIFNLNYSNRQEDTDRGQIPYLKAPKKVRQRKLRGGVQSKYKSGAMSDSLIPPAGDNASEKELESERSDKAKDTSEMNCGKNKQNASSKVAEKTTETETTSRLSSSPPTNLGETETSEKDVSDRETKDAYFSYDDENIGKNQEFSLRNLAKMIVDESVRNGPNVQDTERPSDVHKSFEVDLPKVEGSEGVEDEQKEKAADSDYYLEVKPADYQPGDTAPLHGPNVVYIEGLPPLMDDQDIFDLMSSCGKVLEFKVLRDMDTKKCIGLAYIRFEESSSCELAIAYFSDEESPFPGMYEDNKEHLLRVRMSGVDS